MKRLLSLVAFFATVHASAQQVNPVPDYVFRNQMSVGRNAVTDTGAYFSVGPRYGANKGLMPPMVVDTASFSANKRNGLLIFSVQKNKFLYWDSVGVKWAEMAGTGGSAITGLGVAGYMPEFTTTTNLDTTRLYHSGGKFGVGTTNPQRGVHINDTLLLTSLIIDTANGLAFEQSRPAASNVIFASAPAYIRRTSSQGFNSYSNFYTSRFGDSALRNNDELGQFFFRGKFRDNQPNWLSLDSAMLGKYKITYRQFATNKPTAKHSFISRDSTSTEVIYFDIDPVSNLVATGTNTDINGRLRVIGNEMLVNTTTDAGNYSLQVSGATYQSGSVGTQSVINTTFQFGAANVYQQSGSNVGWIGNGSSSVAGGSTSDFGMSSQGAIFFAITGNRAATINSGSEFLIGSSTTDAGDYKLQVTGNIYNTGSITTGAPSGGSIKPWKIGEAATVSPTSPNRTLRVEVDGVVYYIHAKTTND